MLRLKRLQDQAAAIHKDMEGILDTCSKEERSIGEGEGKEKEKDTFAALEKRFAEIQTSIEIETRQRERLTQLSVVPDRAAPLPEAPERRDEPEVKAFTLPATAIRHTSLRNFKGPNAEEDAYQAGMWFRAIAFRDERAIRFCRDHGIKLERSNWSSNREYRTAGEETTNSLGGFLVPDLIERRIIVLRETYGVFRREADIVPMGSDTVNIPRQIGGLTSYFVAENTAVTESNLTWDQVQLVAKKLAVLTKWSTELDEDAIISMGDKLAGDIAYVFSLKEDQCGFIGDTTATYGGMTGIAVKINDGTHTASIVTAAATHTGFDTLTLKDFNAVMGKLPLYARPNAKWYVSSVGFSASMEALMYAAGGNTVQTIGGASGPSFMGYPVVFSQVLNSVVGANINAIKLLFGDLKLSSTMGTRRGITLKTSAERYLELDQLAILGTERFIIENHDLGDNTNAGPIIALKTPAA